MITALKSYPTYKPSGVERLGDVPEHWDVHKLRSILTGVTERNRPELPLLSVVREKGVILRDVANMDENHNFIPDDLTNYKVVHKGQFAMNKMKAWQGSYGVSRHAGIVSPAYFIFDISEVTRDYFHVAVRSKSYVPFFTQASDGVRIGQWDLSQARMREIPLLVPSNAEQTAIVRFLDHVDRRIRRYIRAKQKLITLLEEQKQAIIHQAVTGQVDVRTGQPYPAYKPSGVEWLGDVPEHWEVRRNGRLFVQRNETGFPELPILEVSLNTGIRIRDFENSDRKQIMAVRSEYKRAVKGDIAYNMMRMWQGAVGVIPVDGLVSPAYVVARPLKGTESRYFSALFRTNVYMAEVDKYSHGIVKDRNRLYWENFKQMPTPYPTPDEQVCIVRYLDKATAAIATDRAHRQISLLSEYRTRLIADVVTGKLDVREAAAGLPEVDPLAGEFDALTTEAAETGMMELGDATETPEELAMENEVTI